MAEADNRTPGGGVAGAIDVSDRCSRLLGELCFAGGPIDPRAIRALAFLTDSVDVSGSSVSITGTPAVDVSDRAARLLGITYGSQGQQILQRAATFDLEVQLRSAGVEIDPRQIRALTSADVVDVSDRAARLLGIVNSITNTVTVQATDLDIRNLTKALDEIYSVLRTDAGVAYDARQIRALTSADVVDVSDRVGRLLGVVNSITNAVDVSDRAARLLGVVYGGYSDDSLLAAVKLGTLPARANAAAPLWTEGNTAPLSVDLTGALRVAGAAGGGVAQTQVRNAGDAAWVNVGVGAEGANILHMPVRVQGTGANVIEPMNSNPVGTEYALPVRNIPSGIITPTNPIIDYNVTAGLGRGSSSTHTYTATGNLRISSIEASASGAMKIEIKTGNSGSETTKLIAFTTETNLTAQLRFHEELQLTAGQRIQIILTNRESQTMDVYSTVLGFNA